MMLSVKFFQTAVLLAALPCSITGLGNVTMMTTSLRGATAGSKLARNTEFLQQPYQPQLVSLSSQDLSDHVFVGCFRKTGIADETARHSVSGTPEERAAQCNSNCFTRRFGIFQRTCRCYADTIELERLAIGDCNKVQGVPTDKRMELYFKPGENDECAIERTVNVRRFLTEEDDVPFGLDIVTNNIRNSPFELYNDECGTNMYEIQTELDRGSHSMKTDMVKVEDFANERRTELTASVSTTATGSYDGAFVSVKGSVSASADIEQTNVFKSTGTSTKETRVFTSTGVQRVAEVKIEDGKRLFVTLNTPFINLLTEYKDSGFNSSKADTIIQGYGHAVLTRGLFGGYMRLRSTMDLSKLGNSLETEENARQCFDVSMSAEAEGFGFTGSASGSVDGCNDETQNRMKAARAEFSTLAGEEQVVGGRKDENGRFVVNPQDPRLLTAKEHYPVNDGGAKFLLLSDFLQPEKISPLTVQKSGITEKEFGEIRLKLQDHILETLQDVEEKLDDRDCPLDALPFINENNQGDCYEQAGPAPLPGPLRGQYTMYTTGGCIGRNELGGYKQNTLRKCANLCTITPMCVSFEYDENSNDCQLSSSCDEFDMTVKDTNDRFNWFLKDTANSAGPQSHGTYTMFTTGGCIGRNELGSSQQASEKLCAEKCSIQPLCNSFEYQNDGETCRLSVSCDDYGLTVKDQNDPNNWFLKNGKTASYTKYSTGGCIGRNELGRFGNKSWKQCRDKCSKNPLCVSFEYLKNGRDCQLSSSCDSISMTVQNPNDQFDWYLRDA